MHIFAPTYLPTYIVYNGGQPQRWRHFDVSTSTSGLRGLGGSLATDGFESFWIHLGELER